MNLGKVVLITGVTLVKSFMGIQKTQAGFPNIYNAFLLIYDLTDAEYYNTITLISQEIQLLY